ncbi:MAG: hypothetical protein EOP51_17815 [Sphingobacteriales bacterium]|nr:MAG: hypothetical protein EOP51_17815 [Sphingobacteriales bacterium]
MRTFETKVQYNGFEIGEFTDIAHRTLEETLLLVDAFPWQENQMQETDILTFPSVTIENNSGNYLKLGCNYSREYQFYFVSEGSLYVNMVNGMDSVADIIEHFFCDKDLTPFFRKDILHFLVKRHFVAKEFAYRIRWYKEIIFAILPLLAICAAIIILISGGNIFLTLFAFVVPFSFGSGLLFFQLTYLVQSFGRTISISRGVDLFEYGFRNKMKKYSKSQIKRIRNYQCSGSRNIFGFFTATLIEFNDGDSILINSTLISDMTLHDKFRWINKIRTIERAFPRIIIGETIYGVKY